MSTESTPAASHDGDGLLAARRAPRISQADVFQAADELLVQGDRPTIDRVRMRLGRGSPNTINDHLDAWWAKLGARLRDLPGHEFPQLPERVAHTLQQLWNEALDGAHVALQDTLHEREQALRGREQMLETRYQQVAERERALTERAGALEESLSLAREQLAANNQRAQALERSVQERDAEGARLRTRIESIEAECTDWRVKFDAASTAHQAERGQIQERHAAAESHWLVEVDQARQHAKEAGKEYEHQTKELRRRLEAVMGERDGLRQSLLESRAELKTAAAVREQLEERLRAAEHTATERPSIAPAKSTGRSHTKRSRSVKARPRT